MNSKFVTILFLLIIHTATGERDPYEFPIRRSEVRSSWQSSFGDGPTCFYNRNQSDEESVLSDATKSHKFFHSADKTQADGGFHWFAVQLKEPLRIRSVTVKGREDKSYHSYVYNRVIGIEIWTSSRSGQIFSGDHCGSQDMSRQFTESLLAWRLCGVIDRTLGSIAKGENLTVECKNESTEARHLLLRKNVSRKEPETEDDDVMSFSDLKLQVVGQVRQSSTPHPVNDAVFPAITSVLVTIFLTFICGLALLRARRLKLKSREARPGPAPMQSQVPPRKTFTPVHKIEPKLRPSSCSEPECSYMSVDHAEAPGDNDSDFDTTSNCTVYVEIVADAHAV